MYFFLIIFDHHFIRENVLKLLSYTNSNLFEYRSMSVLRFCDASPIEVDFLLDCRGRS